jgi:hypothetical protein
MQEIKKRIIIKKVEGGVAEIFYLTPEMGKMNSEGFREIKLATRRNVIKLETYQVNSKINKEQIRDLEALHGGGIDLLGMVKSALENEAEMKIQKLISSIIKYAGEQNYKMCFSKWQMFLNRHFSYVPKKRINSEGDIAKILICESNKIASLSRLGNANYIIVSPGMGARIMDMVQFVFNDPNQPSLDQGSGFIYKAGMIGYSLDVLVDPMMKFNDMTVIVGKNTQENSEGIYMAFEDSELNQFDQVDLGLLDPHIMVQLKSRLAVYPTENAHLQYMTFEFTDKPHNIFTHLYHKIFKK